MKTAHKTELVLIALPAGAVLRTIRDCAGTGVKAVVIFSAGFAESGEEGRAVQHEIQRNAVDAGMRNVGPYDEST